MKKLKLKKSEVLVLRKCNKDFTSYKGFIYPEKGFVEGIDFMANEKVIVKKGKIIKGE